MFLWIIAKTKLQTNFLQGLKKTIKFDKRVIVIIVSIDLFPMWKQSIPDKNFIFQQDGALCYLTKTTKNG